MDYAAQPPGTTADQALTNRGPDPDVIAASTYAFFNAIRSIVCHRQVAGNRLASPNSVITSLIGGFFLTLDAGVLAGSPASSLPSPQALADLVAFLEHIGCNFAGKRYKTDEELWSDVRASGYDEFLEWLSSAESAGINPDPRCLLTVAKMYATEPPVGGAAAQNAFSWVRLTTFEMLAQPVGDSRGLYRLTGLPAYSYFVGLPTLSLSRDRAACRPVRAFKAVLAEAKERGLPGSTLDAAQPAASTRCVIGLLLALTTRSEWCIRMYDAPLAGQPLIVAGAVDDTRRCEELTDVMGLSSSKPDVFRFVFGRCYPRLRGAVEDLHDLLVPPPASGPQTLELIDNLHRPHGGRGG